MVDAFITTAGNVRFTIYPGVEHPSSTRRYDNPERYKWFLAQKRGVKNP